MARHGEAGIKVEEERGAVCLPQYDYRLSITLVETPGQPQPTIRIIVVDSQLAPDRFDIKELGRELRDNVHS
jgi:hypothetical protein